jgi:hypothetical protein
MVGCHLVVRYQTRLRIFTGTILLLLLVYSGTSSAQESPAAKPPDQPMISKEEAVQNPSAPCVQPPPMVRFQDYDGPFQKTIGLFTQQLERKSVHPPHFKPGAELCSLEIKDKFLLFVRGSFDPIIFLSSGFNAGISQAQNDDPTFGQGTAGYAKRFGAAYADQATSRFFKDFAYPTIFREDPRYYRLAQGTGRQRFLHAIEHSVVAHTDHGNRMFNFSEWLGTLSAVSLGNIYHPGNKRGVGPTAEGVSIAVASDMGFDVLREFWPEISRKLKLPFRTDPAENSGSSSAAR